MPGLLGVSRGPLDSLPAGLIGFTDFRWEDSPEILDSNPLQESIRAWREFLRTTRTEFSVMSCESAGAAARTSAGAAVPPTAEVQQTSAFGGSAATPAWVAAWSIYHKPPVRMATPNARRATPAKVTLWIRRDQTFRQQMPELRPEGVPGHPNRFRSSTHFGTERVNHYLCGRSPSPFPRNPVSAILPVPRSCRPAIRRWPPARAASERRSSESWSSARMPP